MKKLLCILLAVIMIAVISAPCAAEPEDTLGVSCPSAVLMHPSGKVLYEKNSHERLAPASVTKVMTLLLVMEALEAGQISLEEPVTGSAHASSMGGSQIWLEAGEQLTVDEMIKCVVVVSANDCSVALAEHIAGTEEAFVARMNERAVELGMNDTHFVNCCGLDAEGHLTTAYDIALMSAELLKHEKIKDYTLIWQDSIRGGSSLLTNTNKLVKTYEGITGLKTGSTSTAGFCLSASAERDGLELIAVVMKGETSAKRNADVTAMLNYGFATFASAELTSDRPIMPVPVELGKISEVACELQHTDPIVIEKYLLGSLEKEIVLAESLTAPVQKGDTAGEMRVRSQGEVILTVPIVTAAEVERIGLLDIFSALMRAACMKK
ncbi:MAG: D-alanyl-D-alanine carboxypeptidase [Clostridia bacterium]|nr:D-alanyl-D-alanine carboxypeptidase [Clostridia bacterium]